MKVRKAFDIKTRSILTKRSSCSSCGNSLHTIMDYGNVTLAGFFPSEPKPDAMRFPLSLMVCSSCFLVQTDSTIDPDVLFKDYRYMSSIGLSGHFSALADSIASIFPDRSTKILEIGSNDGVLLLPLMKLGYSPIGFEPSKNISSIARTKGCNVTVDYFNTKTASKHVQEGSMDLIVSSNCLAHIPNINDVVDAASYCLRDGGMLIMEVHYGRNVFEYYQFDNVYHEHNYYYTLASLEPLFAKYGLFLSDAEELNVHAGSLRVTFMKNVKGKTPRAWNKLKEEISAGVMSLDYYDGFRKSAHDKIAAIRSLIDSKNGRRIIGYGASGRANVLCDMLKLDKAIIHHIVDESPERAGRHIQDIPIVFPHNAVEDGDVVVIFAWNYAKMIMEKLKNKNVEFIIPLPEPTLVSHASELSSLISL